MRVLVHTILQKLFLAYLTSSTRLLLNLLIHSSARDFGSATAACLASLLALIKLLLAGHRVRNELSCSGTSDFGVDHAPMPPANSAQVLHCDASPAQ